MDTDRNPLAAPATDGEVVPQRHGVAKRSPGPGRALLIILSAAAAIGGVIALFSDSGDFEYYKHVDEVTQAKEKWRQKRLQLHGFVVPGSIAKRIDRDRQLLEYKFRTENCGAVLETRFAGVVPDTFKDGAEVVLKGKLEGDTFITTEVMAKCPSKYAQAGEAQSAMVTRCARDTKAQKGN